MLAAGPKHYPVMPDGKEIQMIDLMESTAHMLRGMCMDPRIPHDSKEAMWSRVRKIDAATEAAGDDAAGDSDLLDMVRWAYGKLHHANYSKQEDALMLDRMKLLLEHGA